MFCFLYALFSLFCSYICPYSFWQICFGANVSILARFPYFSPTSPLTFSPALGSDVTAFQIWLSAYRLITLSSNISLMRTRATTLSTSLRCQIMTGVCRLLTVITIKIFRLLLSPSNNDIEGWGSAHLVVPYHHFSEVHPVHSLCGGKILSATISDIDVVMAA